MLDVLLCSDGDYEGDLDLTENGDIQLGSDLLQNVKVAVSWIKGEWRLGPDIGLPWFEDIWIKNPNINTIRQDVRNAIMSVDGVTDAKVQILEYDAKSRKIRLYFYACTTSGNYSDEVTIYG